MAEPTTQQFLELEQIREGVVVLKDKSLRGVIMVSSLNFDLKAEEEKNAIIYQFQDFLNSLDFSIEIIVQSRKLNITGYLEKLENLESQQKTELMKIQTADYRKFIDNLVKEGNIMSKTFFVVVPFTLIEIPTLKFGKTAQTSQGLISLTEEQFQRAKSQLLQRMEFVILGLRRCGLQCFALYSPDLIELFWSLYHPEEAEVGYYPEVPPELIQ